MRARRDHRPGGAGLFFRARDVLRGARATSEST
jgi:hypothetical protein